jgi:hypothetical protein
VQVGFDAPAVIADGLSQGVFDQVGHGGAVARAHGRGSGNGRGHELPIGHG